MKTKKAILAWYESKGNEMQDLNDLQDLYSKLDKNLTFTQEYTKHDTILTFNKWKLPIKLFFSLDTQECFKIVY